MNIRIKRFAAGFSLFAPLWLALVALCASGCRSMTDVVQGEGTGKKVEYAAPFDTVWAAMPGVVTNLDLQLCNVSPERHLVQAKDPGDFWQAGTYVAIFVQPVSATNCTVEVVSKRTVSVDAFAGTYAKPIFRQLDKQFKPLAGDVSVNN